MALDMMEAHLDDEESVSLTGICEVNGRDLRFIIDADIRDGAPPVRIALSGRMVAEVDYTDGAGGDPDGSPDCEVGADFAADAP